MQGSPIIPDNKPAHLVESILRNMPASFKQVLEILKVEPTFVAKQIAENNIPWASNAWEWMCYWFLSSQNELQPVRNFHECLTALGITDTEAVASLEKTAEKWAGSPSALQNAFNRDFYQVFDHVFVREFPILSTSAQNFIKVVRGQIDNWEAIVQSKTKASGECDSITDTGANSILPTAPLESLNPVIPELSEIKELPEVTVSLIPQPLVPECKIDASPLRVQDVTYEFVYDVPSFRRINGDKNEYGSKIPTTFENLTLISDWIRLHQMTPGWTVHYCGIYSSRNSETHAPQVFCQYRCEPPLAKTFDWPTRTIYLPLAVQT